MKARVSSIMTKRPYRVNVSDSISKVYEIIKEKNIRHIPVMDDRKVVGIISSTDITAYNLPSLESSLHFTPHSLTAKDIMTSGVKVLKEDDLLEDFVDQFISKGMRSLPVVDSEEMLIGVVSSSDIIKTLYQNA